ncbi:MAG TPA: ABC transporter permease [Thermoanaerobaculia bacterium]|nr:ABC transporter permease [Thermoanaerobaculia bacterium]
MDRAGVTVAIAPAPPLVIRARRGRPSLGLADLWEYRELFYFLVWRDLKVRYKQSVFGAGWAVFQPLATMAVFTVVFSRIAGIDSGDVPYPIFCYAALLPWTFFSRGTADGAASLLGAAAMISKIYFPRLIVPAAAVLRGLVDAALSAVVFAGLMVWYRQPPTPALAALPLFVLLAVAATLGTGFWLSALNVRYRDVKYVVPFFLQLWLFVTPVIYPTARATELLHSVGLPGWFYGLNPMAGVVEGFRWSLLGETTSAGVMAASGGVSILLLLVGALYFRRVERTFADVL